MPHKNVDVLDSAHQRQMALSRWDNEGGAQPGRTKELAHDDVPDLTNSELVQLRVRVIALENVVIALLADANEWQLDHVREMAAYISPRPGYTQHPLTLHAADQMIQLVERAGHFREVPPE
ncbi:MAG: hypothetical protein ACT4QA_22810 [Panacagrimonas sp.]